MKKRLFCTVLCLTLALILVLALAATANAQGTDTLRDPVDPGQAQSSTPTLEIAFKNLSYSSNIYVLYAVRYENVESLGQIKMLFWNAPQNNGYLKGTEAYAADAERTETIGGVSHVIFYSEGVAPKELPNTQYCRAYVQVNGVDYYSEVIKYNPLSYIKTVLAGDSEIDKPLVTALMFKG